MLEDIRVLDLSHVWFGPWSTLMLSYLGAEVIKIEPPWGSIGRVGRGPLYGGASYMFHHLNLNKKDLAINLKDPKGLKIFKELVPVSDVVVQNFSVGTMEKLGIGYDVLKKLNPKIIYAALSGFGQTGPYAKRPSYAPIAEAMSGHARLTGDNLDPTGPPIRIAQALGDLGPGTMAAMSIVAAIRYRDKTGEGQMIDVSQLDCMIAYNVALTGYMMTGLKPFELREKYPRVFGLSGIVQAKDGGWIQIAGNRPKALDNLRNELDVEEATFDMIKEIISNMDRDEAVKYFLKLGFPVAPVYNLEEIPNDPQVKARNLITQIEHPRIGSLRSINFPVKLSGYSTDIKKHAPLFGQNNREIVVKLLGYSEEEYRELINEGVIIEE